MAAEQPSDYLRDDSIYPFMVDKHDIRGRVIRLSDTVHRILSQHDYPAPISRLLGEMVVLVAMLGDMFKSEQLITVQVKSEGIVRTLIADYMEGGRIRGYANIELEAYEALCKTVPEKDLTFTHLLGKGFLSLTIDPQNEKDRYQGIVELQGNNLKECIETYFKNSEQLATALSFAVGEHYQDGKKLWRAGGLMIQRLPTQPSTMEETEDSLWEQAGIFVNTLTSDELLDPTLGADQLLYRLFHQEGVWIYPHKPVTHGCRCTKEKAENLLSAISKEELDGMQIEGNIIVTCQFCGRHYPFPRELIEARRNAT